jgi:radical SAM superfamily enzyme YgiQ (UPF0313 family)
VKISLISPKGPLYRYKGGIFKKSLRYQPLTLTTLSSLIPRELDCEVTMIDEGIQNIPGNVDADLIGMTVITGTASRCYQLADQFRRQGIFVVLGGPHVTLLPDEAMKHADAICVGYAEQSWPQLLRDFAAKQPKKRYDQGDLFELGYTPFADRDAFDKRLFLTQAVFEATRSCQHNCEFCVAPSAWGRKQLQRPIDWVVEDIVQFGQKKIIFVDLNIVSDKTYAKELFEALAPLNIQWYGLSTVLIAHDRELMELMARSGCRGLLLGLESIGQASLFATQKPFNTSVNYKQLIADLHRLNISVQGCFVFGLDEDRETVFDATAEFAIDAGIDLPRFAILTPFPGTPLYRRLDAEGRILNTDWELYDGQHVVFQPRHLSVEELNDGHERAWKKVYRWRSIARRLYRAGNLRPLGISANLGYRYYAHHLHSHYNCDWPVSPVLPSIVSKPGNA